MEFLLVVGPQMNLKYIQRWSQYFSFCLFLLVLVFVQIVHACSLSQSILSSYFKTQPSLLFPPLRESSTCNFCSKLCAFPSTANHFCVVPSVGSLVQVLSLGLLASITFHEIGASSLDTITWHFWLRQYSVFTFYDETDAVFI